MEAADGASTKRSAASRLLISCGLVLAPVWLAAIAIVGKCVVDALAPLIAEPPAPAPPGPAPAPSSTLPPPPTPAEEVASLRRQLAQERRSRQRALTAEAAVRSTEAALRMRIEDLESALRKAQASNGSAGNVTQSRNLTEAEEQLLRAEAKVRALRAEVAKSSSEVQVARRRAAEDERRVKELEGRVGELESLASSSGGPMAEWLRGIGHQQVLAVVLGAIGALGIAGPSSVVRGFLAVVGSAVGGLLLGSSVGFLAASLAAGDPPDGQGGEDWCWLDAALQLLSGQAGGWSYTLAGLGLALGVLRWLIGFEYALFVVVDEVYSSRPVADVYLRKPLLGHDSQDHGDESLDGESSASTCGRGTPGPRREHLAAMQRDAGAASASGARTPGQGSGKACRGLERLQELAGEASRSATAGNTLWPSVLWSGVDVEVRAGEVDDDIVALLAAHGYNPGRASDSIVPDLHHLCQALAEAAWCRQAARAEAAAAAASALLTAGGREPPGGAGVLEDSSSHSSRQRQPPSLSQWPPPHDIPSATPPQHAGAHWATPPRLAGGHPPPPAGGLPPIGGAPPPPVGGRPQGSSRSSSASSPGRRLLRQAAKDLV